MKLFFILLSSLLISPSESNLFNDFDYQLMAIAKEFRESIIEDPCHLKEDIMYLIDDIDDALDDFEKYSSQELHNLKEMHKKAEALEEYISSLGGCNLMPISSEDFYIANSLVGGNVYKLADVDYCFQIVIVKINEVEVHLAWNKSSYNYTVQMEWSLKNSSLDRMASGSHNFGLPSNNLRPLQTSKEDILWNEKKVSILSCKEW